MKKIIAVFMALVMAFMIAVPSIAAKADVTPVIIVGGVGTRSYYENYGTEDEVRVFPPTPDVVEIITLAATGIVKTVVTRDLNCLSEMIGKILESVFEKFKCNADGDSKYENIGSVYYPLSIDNYEFDFENEVPEVAIAGTVAQSIGAENTYFYNYDWRLDPCANASGLDYMIQQAKQKAGSDKVTLIPCSMGGVQTLAYLNEYGSEDIEKIIFMSSAHKGLLFVSEMFTGHVEFSQKNIFKYLSDFVNLGNEDIDDAFDLLCSYFGTAPYLSGIFKFVDYYAQKLNNETTYDSLKRVFGSMPGMWAFVCNDYFDDARAFMTDENTSEALLEKIDYYHANVGSRADEILLEAKENGTSVCVFSHYNKGSVPVTPKANVEGDNLIETPCTSIGATVAFAGETLGECYVQANYCGGHNHVSPDNRIDASTCLFPDSTWFIKYEEHVGCKYNSDYAQLVKILNDFDGQPTVFDFEEYPQFLKTDMKGMTLSPVTAKEPLTIGSLIAGIFSK
ncbi:MAG: hypothetical protein IJU45_04000 [Clostridia bacterium]|nr:hypothetical protein [Clostridia bacterium]